MRLAYVKARILAKTVVGNRWGSCALPGATDLTTASKSTATAGMRSQLLDTLQEANNDAQFGVQTSARLYQKQLVVQLDHISGSKEYAV